MTARVAQMVLNVSIADAITHHVLTLDDLLREGGHGGGIYCENAHPDLAHRARSFRELDAGEVDAVLFHFSIGSEIGRSFAELDAKRVVVYHNITPPEFYDGVNGRVARALRRGRSELAELKDRVDLAVGVSEFNRGELVELGFPETGILPLAVPDDLSAVQPDPEWLARFDGEAPIVLHVGRIAPNKRFDDLLRTFGHLQVEAPGARLLLIGTDRDTETYAMGLHRMARELGLEGVLFLGQVPAAALAACYRRASAYLCTSEHEGFCLPLLEAMHFDLPVVAMAAGGIPETLGGAGVLLESRDPRLAARALDLVVSDGQVREAVVARQRRRLGDFAPRQLAESLHGVLERVGCGGGRAR